MAVKAKTGSAGTVKKAPTMKLTRQGQGRGSKARGTRKLSRGQGR
jgi:hypothetical protein